MTDRPTIEQQLDGIIAREVFEGVGARRPSAQRTQAAAAAIVAAVNNGAIDPIVPENALVVTADDFPWNVVAEEQAERASLRALKAKIDGCTSGWNAGVLTPTGHQVRYAGDLLLWLRGDTE